eukprot:IDg9389t1
MGGIPAVNAVQSRSSGPLTLSCLRANGSQNSVPIFLHSQSWRRKLTSAAWTSLIRIGSGCGICLRTNKQAICELRASSDTQRSFVDLLMAIVCYNLEALARSEFIKDEGC